MADANKVLEGSLKYRDGKKWKQRWCILQRLSPVADCLHMFLYKERSDCIKVPSKSVIVLEDFFGLKRGFVFDKESHILSIICRNRAVNLAFNSQEMLNLWELTIAQHLGEGKSFEANLVRAPQSLKVMPGPVGIYVNRSSICLVRSCSNGSLPRYLASWRIGELRRFGILGNRFCFELEEKNAGGIFLLETSLLNELNRVVSNIAHGRGADSPLLPSKLCCTGTEPGVVVESRLKSPVNKSSSLDRNSFHTNESSKFDTECGNTVEMRASFHRRLSEPQEFPISAEIAADRNDKTGCYDNIWCCNEAPGKIIVGEKLIAGCLEVSEKVTDGLAKTGSLSKMCCLPGSECCETGKNCSCCCASNTLTYVNMQNNESKQLRHCSSACEQRSNVVRPALRCASSDMLRCRKDEETRSLLSNDSDYANGGIDTVKNSLQHSRRNALARRSSDDPPSARDPLKPLPYVDLRRFDGDAREGYLYDLKVPRTVRREFSSAGVGRSVPTLARPPAYSHLPKSAGVSMCAPEFSRDAPKPLAVGGRSAFHASLKRQNKFSIPAKDLLSFVPPAPSAGSYADLRHDSSAISMLRGSSYYNVQLNTVIPPPPCQPDAKLELPLAPRKLPPTPGTTSFGGNKYVAAEVLDVSVPCANSLRNFENKPEVEVEYVLMNGRSDSDDSAIFYSVNIPIKREDLQEADGCDSKNVLSEPIVAESSCVVVPSTARNVENTGYVDMSGVSAVSSSRVNPIEQIKLFDCCPQPESTDRPKLRHSRSLEMQLNSPRKTEGLCNAQSWRTSGRVIEIKKKRHCSPEERKDFSPSCEYIPMDNVSVVEATSKAEQFQTFPDPSDDLVAHAHSKVQMFPGESDQLPDIQTDRTDMSNWSRHKFGSFASDPAINSLSERNSLLKSCNSLGRFSRLFRRHSSANEKTTLANFKLLSVISRSNAAGDELHETLRDVTSDGHREPPRDVKLQILALKSSSSRVDGLSNSSCNSSLERLGPPPPVPTGRPHYGASEASGNEHYMNLSSIMTSSVLPPSDGSSNYLNITPLTPPPLPPKNVSMSKNQEIDSLHRNVALPVDKILPVEKQPLRSITEDEQEVPPLPEKIRVRSACASKIFSADVVPSAVPVGVEASPKPPVPPRSTPASIVSSSACTTSAQRSPRGPVSPVVRYFGGMEAKSRKPNMTVDIASTSERRGSKDDAAVKGSVQLRHLSDLRQSVRVRMVSEMSNVSVSSGEDGRPSPALTTMRPRYGKEYQCVDRRRLFEEGSPFSPQRSPSVASSVFTFDNTPSNLRGGVSGNCSSGENSPKYPSGLRSRIANDHVSSSRNISPIVLDPMVDSPPAVEAKVLLNYAEIDLSATEMAPAASVQRAASRTDSDKTEYTLIDLIATSAASRVGRERARQREDKERMAEALSNELKEGRSGTGARSVTLGERKGLPEVRRTPSKEQRYNLFS